MVNMLAPQQTINVTYDWKTRNQSFLDMHYFLRNKGLVNNKFFLVLYDSDLLGVDPRDPRLNIFMKRKILAECMRNYWYFIRNVVRIPVQGGEVGGGVPYKLTRANLAMSFGFVMNWNMFLEIPRQNGKTVSALCWYLWVFLFGTRNSKMLFLNKKLDDSKMNLQTLKDIRDSLPDYLRMNSEYGINGKKLKAKNSAETISNLSNNNLIKTAPSARTKMLASNLGRGATLPFLYMDEYAFIPFNYIIYETAAPAFSRAAKNARDNGAPYGILITTTPGDMLSDEGMEAYNTKESATKFSEMWYDATPQELRDIEMSNTKSNFMYIRYTYRELGRGEDYFEEMVKILKSNWPAIRREVLLEWSESSENSPFEKEDLDAVKRLVRKPIREVWIGKPTYVFQIYKDGLFYKYPPIIGVDVAGGMSKDSSAITIVDTETTEVLATFNNNFIPVNDLAKVIYELVKTKMPNAIVNIERNGGFGASVLSYLLSKPDIKKNLYYEIKDRVFEERSDGFKTIRNTKKVKVYGSDNTKENRLKLMEILAERMRYHKDKFVSEIIYNELTQLEVKKNGRIEHADNGHDDQIFSYLWALYVWYEGKNVMENWHLVKNELKTDEEFETVDAIYDESNMIDIGLELVTNDELNDMVQSQIKEVSNTFILQSDFTKVQEQESEKAMQKLINENPLARKAYAKKYNIAEEDLIGGEVDISSEINDYYIDDNPYDIYHTNDGSLQLQNQFNNIKSLR